MNSDSNSKSVAFSRRFKNKLFFLFHNLLLFKDIPSNLGAALLILQLFQLLVLTFNGKAPYLDSYFFSYIISDIDVIQLYPVVDRYFNVDARIVMNLFLLAFVLGISVSLVILSNQKDYMQNVRVQNLAYLLGFFYEVTTKLLFVPIFGTFIITLKCDSDIITCFSGSHIILLVTSIAGIVLLLIVSYTIDAFFFDFSFKSQDSLAHAPVSDFVLGFIYKTVAVILTVGIFDLEYSSLVALYHIVFNFFFLHNSIKKVTYFDIKVHVSYLISSATLIWTNGSLVAVDLIEFELLRQNTIIIIIVGSIFFVNFCRNIRQKTQDNLLTKEAGELESDILLDAKVRFLFKLAKSARSDSQSDLLLASLIKIHVDHCVDGKCPCKMRENLYDPKRSMFGDSNRNPHKDLTFIKHFIYQILKSGSIKFFNSELLFLDSIFFLFESMRNYPQAYHLIHLYEKKNLSNNPRIVMQFIIYRLYARMKDYMTNRNKKVMTTTLTYEKIMEYDEELTTLKTMVFAQIEHYINIWEMIDSEFPDLNILNKLLEKTFNHKEKVIEQYKKTVKVNDQSLEMKIIMETYSKYVAYDDDLASKVAADIKTKMAMDNHSDNFNFSRDMGTWNIFDQNCYTIEIANQMDRLGQIINFSKNSLSLLGYQDQELRFQNVKILIPRVVALQHDRILKDFFQNGLDSGLREPFHNFSINNKGYCFSCHIIIKAIPMHGFYRLMALFRKLNQYDYIITDERGIMDTFGEKIGQLLELPPQSAQQAKLNLALIAPKTIKYFHYYLIKKEKAMVESSLNKSRSFYIFVPNNWKTFLQRWQEKRRGKGAISIPSLSSNLQESDDIADIDEYYDNLLEYMGNDMKKNFKKIIKVKATVEHIVLRKGEIQMKSLKITSCKEKNPEEVPIEKIRKQEQFIPILSKKIRKILEQKRIEIAHQLELAKNIAEENEEGEGEAEEDGVAKEPKQKDAKDKKQKGVWGNILDKAKKQGATSKKSEKSLDTLLHADSKESEQLHDDKNEEESFENFSSDQVTPQQRDSGGSSQPNIVRVDTEKTLVKKPSILKKKSMKDQDGSSERRQTAVEKFKKRVKIIQKEKRKSHPPEEAPTTPEKDSKEKKDKDSKKQENVQGYVSLLTEESSSYDAYEAAENGQENSIDESKVINNKERKQMFKELAEEGVKEAQDLLDTKKNVGPSSVASASSYQSKDFSSKIKDLLKARYVPVSLRMSNMSEILLTLMVMILTNILSAIIRSQVGQWVDSIQTINTPNLYEVYLFKGVDSYLTLDLLAKNIVSNTLYDPAWLAKDYTERELIYNQIRNLTFKEITNSQSQEDLYPLYFNSDSYNIITKGNVETLRTDFVGYLGLIMNSINKTLNYPVTSYGNVGTDEYLYILNNNFFVTLSFLERQKSVLANTIDDTLDFTQTVITGEQISSIGIIVCSVLIILPMFLQHNLHLEEVLVLFTNVSKRDSDFYYKHYRTIRLTWNSNYDDANRLQKEITEDVKLAELNKKRSKLQTNTKTRSFLRLKRDYKKFIIIISSSILVFAALATVKALSVRSGLSDINAYLEDFKVFSEEASSVFKILHNYKLLLSTVAKGGKPTAQEMLDFQTRLKELDRSIEFSLPIKDQEDIGISQQNIDRLQWILVGDICELLAQNLRAECNSLFNGVLAKGFLAVRYDLYAFATNYFKRFSDVMNSNQSNLVQLSKDMLNDVDLKDFLRAWTFIQQLIFEWLEASYGDMQSKKDNVLWTFNLFLAILCLSLLVNLLTWRYSYIQLVETLFKFHRYFETLPLELIRENRSMRYYFEKYFRLKEKS